MNRREGSVSWLGSLFGAVLLLLVCAPRRAAAVPSFSRQTGMSCSFCHTVFPGLTAEGRKFKLLGYVTSADSGDASTWKQSAPASGPSVQASGGDSGDDEGQGSLPILASAPIGASIQISDNFLARPANDSSGNPVSWTASSGSDGMGVAQLPTAVSLFYAGRIASKAGAFIQATYDSDSGVFHLDSMTDVRYADEAQVDGTDLIWGLTANSAPTMQDVWNTVPMWSFPYLTSTISPMAAAGTRLDDMGAAGNEGGLGAYAYWNDLLYTEIAGYRATPQGGGSYLAIQGVAPYWRVALQHGWDDDVQSLEVGTLGFAESTYPSGVLPQGPTDQFTDLAFDTQYQYVGDSNLVTGHAIFIHENQDRGYSFGNGASSNSADNLQSFRVDGSYYYHRKVGFTIGYFDTEGSTDALLYPQMAFMGSADNSPLTRGLVYELNYVPAVNTKLTLQYRSYLDFNGSSGNYDGAGRNAEDNNTLMAIAWLGY